MNTQLTSIIVVDDSALQRGFAVELCQKFGIATIYQAGNGREALDLIHSLDTLPDIALIDLEMPEIDGMALIQQMHAEDIDLPLIIASSRGETLIAAAGHIADALGLEVLGVLQKPIKQEALTALLQDFRQSR